MFALLCLVEAAEQADFTEALTGCLVALKQQQLILINVTLWTDVDGIYSGDKITAIAGIFSGILSWLFETYDGSVDFLTLLIDALAQGITEPDPREYLSGRDVQRKLLILARMASFELSLDDIDCKTWCLRHYKD